MSLQGFFEAKSVAVVGASRKHGKTGHEILVSLIRGGFEGPIWPVNPSADEIEGLPCFADLKAIGQTPDLVVIVVPTPAVLDTVRQCAAVGVKQIIVITSGFKEVGPRRRTARTGNSPGRPQPQDADAGPQLPRAHVPPSKAQRVVRRAPAQAPETSASSRSPARCWPPSWTWPASPAWASASSSASATRPTSASSTCSRRSGRTPRPTSSPDTSKPSATATPSSARPSESAAKSPSCWSSPARPAPAPRPLPATPADSPTRSAPTRSSSSGPASSAASR